MRGCTYCIRKPVYSTYPRGKGDHAGVQGVHVEGLRRKVVFHSRENEGAFVHNTGIKGFLQGFVDGMGPLGPRVAVFVFGVVVILWVWKNVEFWVVIKDVFEVPKIVMSNCGVGIVAGAINVMERGAPVARAKVYCWVYLIIDDLLVVFL